jgi:hypothetical protein
MRIIRSIVKSIFVFWIIVPSNSLGDMKSALFFQPSLNKFRILNQKLDFNIVGHDSIRLGNLLLSNSNMKLEIAGTIKDPIIRFIGPKQFMNSSQILIRDPNGKVLWKKEVLGLNMQTKLISKNTDEIRNEARIYEEIEDAESVLTELSQSSFFNFCLFHEDKIRRFNICSSDYSVSQEQGVWILKVIKSKESENKFLINGAEVGEEGQIQFSKDMTSLSLSVKLLSGLLVEIKTREIPLTFVDYEYIIDKPYLSLWYRENSKELKNVENQAQVELARPFFYIESENQIPLKQELVIDGELLAESEKPRVKFSQLKTYALNMELEIEAKSGSILKALTKGDSLKKRESGSVWKIKNSKYLDSNVHLLEFKRSLEGKPFIASYEVIRGRPWDLFLKGHAKEISNSLSTEKISASGFNLGLNYYLSDILFLPYSKWTHLRWALLSEMSVDNFSVRSNRKQEKNLSLDLIYRLKEGIHHLDPSWSLGLGYLMRSGEFARQSGLETVIRYSDPIVNWYFLGSKILAEIKFVTLSSDQYKDIESGTLINFNFENRYSISKVYNWSWSIFMESERDQLLLNQIVDSKTSGVAFGINRVF